MRLKSCLLLFVGWSVASVAGPDWRLRALLDVPPVFQAVRSTRSGFVAVRDWNVKERHLAVVRFLPNQKPMLGFGPQNPDAAERYGFRLVPTSDRIEFSFQDLHVDKWGNIYILVLSGRSLTPMLLVVKNHGNELEEISLESTLMSARMAPFSRFRLSFADGRTDGRVAVVGLVQPYGISTTSLVAFEVAVEKDRDARIDFLVRRRLVLGKEKGGSSVVAYEPKRRLYMVEWMDLSEAVWNSVELNRDGVATEREMKAGVAGCFDAFSSDPWTRDPAKGLWPLQRETVGDSMLEWLSWPTPQTWFQSLPLARTRAGLDLSREGESFAVNYQGDAITYRLFDGSGRIVRWGSMASALAAGLKTGFCSQILMHPIVQLNSNFSSEHR